MIIEDDEVTVLTDYTPMTPIDPLRIPNTVPVTSYSLGREGCSSYRMSIVRRVKTLYFATVEGDTRNCTYVFYLFLD